MHVFRPLQGVLLLAVLLGTALLGLPAAQASALPTADTASSCVKPPPREDDTIHVVGCLVDTREKPPTPVPGVEISVEDESGNEIGTATSDDTGVFDIEIGPAIDALGNTYTVLLDEDSLPDGADLRNPDQKELKVYVKLQADVNVTFPIGDATVGSGKFAQALQLAVGGLVFALLLALAALGLSLIFGTTGLTNFAHGELITFGAVSAMFIDQLSGDIVIAGKNMTMVIAIVFATIASVLFGWLNDKVLWKPLRRRGTGLIAAMIVSIGLSIFLRNVYQYFAGADAHNYSQWTNPAPWVLGPVSVTPKDVGVAVLAAVVLAVVLVAMRTTKIGKAARAVSDNPALAAASGIDVDKVISIVWALGAGLAGLAGVLLGMTQGFDYQLGFKILLLVFAAVVLGGLGSIWGAVVGALIIGVFIDVSTLIVPAELKFVGALVVLILVLMVRPQGIFGRAERIG